LDLLQHSNRVSHRHSRRLQGRFLEAVLESFAGALPCAIQRRLRISLISMRPFWFRRASINTRALRGPDFPTMHNYLKVALCNVHDELTQKIDASAVARAAGRFRPLIVVRERCAGAAAVGGD
jgi:hypothetical protein